MEGHRRTLRSRKSRMSIRQIHEQSFPTKKRRRLPPLHLYLEEQKENAGEMKTVGTQADKFAPRAKPKPFVPPKRGFDCGVQVDMKYTFNFDLNVKPIVEVIVQKTLEQALMETQHEEVQKALERVQNEFNHKQEKRKQELQERIAKEQKLVEEKEQRKREARKIQEKLKAKLESTKKENMAKNTEPKEDEKPQNDHDYFIISDKILPELCRDIANQLRMGKIAKKLANEIIHAALKRHSEKIQHARNELRNFRIRLQIYGEQEEIGPIILSRNATIGDLAESVSKWYDSTLSIEEIKLYCNKELLELSVPVKQVAASSIVVKIEKIEEEVVEENEEVAEEAAENS